MIRIAWLLASIVLTAFPILEIQVHPLPGFETSISLAGVRGRIDHLSIDPQGGRLFVAALDNNTLEVINLKQRTVIHTISGLHEPQGVLYLSALNRLYIANGEDGTVRVFDGRSYAAIKTTALGDDADNIRYDAQRHLIYVGYGTGGLGC